MKSFVGCLILWMGVFASGAALAASGPYFAAGASASVPGSFDFKQPGLSKEATLDLGYGARLAAGWSFGRFSAEVEGLYLTNSISKFSSSAASTSAAGDFNAMGLFLNGSAHFGPYGYFSPFVTLGAGGLKLDLVGIEDGDQKLGDAADEVLAFQGGLGLDVKLTPKTHFEAGWRYLAAQTANFKGTEVDYKTHLLWAGLKFYLQASD